MLGASAFLPFLPMAPVQIMFNNLMCDVSQTALATDNMDDEYIARPRKWCSCPLITGYIWVAFCWCIWG